MGKRKKKRTVTDLEVSAYAAEGKSIAHLPDGKVVFLQQVVPGDKVEALILKEKKNWAEGAVLRIQEMSADRVTPFCGHFGVCGGCKWQMLPYEKQLAYKQQQVADQLSRLGHLELPSVLPIMGSEAETFYRNKLEFTFSAHRYRTKEELIAANGAAFEEEPALGFHAPGLFDKVVPITTCYLQPEPTNKLLRVLRQYTLKHGLDYYNYKIQSGWLRNVMLRVATTGEVLVNLIVQHDNQPVLEPLLQHLLQEIPEITSLHYTINPKVNDAIYDLDVVSYSGKGFIEERLEDFRFKISPKSFFQTNTRQAERLYQVTRAFAGLTGQEVLYDLYCGTGSIGIFCSKVARKVIGIETIDDAVKDARENAAMNGLTHCQFYSGDVADICTDAFFDTHGRPDVIITDPPRAGMHEKLVQQLMKIQAPRIVYVSCNPATQARDLHLLHEQYQIEKLQPVDMFPHTHHIENVALLTLRTH